MINWTIVTRAEYETKRYSFLLEVEERDGAQLTPYNDNPTLGAAGNITIGVGFNLESAPVRDEVFRTFGLVRDNPALSASAQQVENEYIDRLIAVLKTAGNEADLAELNDIMFERSQDTRLAALSDRRTTFAFLDEQEVRATFDRLMTNIYEPKVDAWLSGIPDSQERAALVSLAWNQKDSSPLLGDKLRAAIQNGDRAEAWYEIRYNSNSAAQAHNIRDGIAKRRYFEADTFGLYDAAITSPAEMDDANAKGAFRTYTRHKEKIDEYDAEFGDRVAAANLDYNTNLVQTREGWFQPARTYLVDNYVTQKGLEIPIDGSILVGEDLSTLYYANTDSDTTLIGAENSDLIFGESGSDVLKGGGNADVIYGGSGDDRIWGEAGDDYLDGGTGVDTYHYRFGEGHDTIVDPDGVNGGRILYIDAEGKYHLLTGGRQSTTDPNLYETLTDDRVQYRLSGSDLIISFDGVEALTVKDAQLPSVNAFLGISLENLGGSLLPQRNNAGDPATWQAVITGGDLDDDLAADSITTRILGGAGDDLLSGRAGETGYVQDIEIFGGSGNDALYGEDFYVSEYYRLGRTEFETQYGVLQPGIGASLYGEVGLDVINGSLRDDRIDGGDDPDTLFAYVGDDTVTGGLGNDWMDGLEGRDVMRGDDGDDRVNAGAGSDHVQGGLNNDVIYGDADTRNLLSWDGTIVTVPLRRWERRTFSHSPGRSGGRGWRRHARGGRGGR